MPRPRLQQPLLLGADIVLHSTTKYIGGHSDVVGGALLTNDGELDEAFGFLQNGAGAVPGPFDAYLTMRGLKTLVLRMQRHSDNAALVAEFLENHPAIETVLYPGLPSHPGHDVAAKQMSAFGGMVSVRLRGWHRGRARLLLADRGFHPRGVTRRRGVADRAPRRDDARVDRRLATRGARRSGPAVGGHRGLPRTCSPTWSRRYVSAARIADAVTARFISGSAVSYSSTQLPLAISPARMCTHRQPRSFRLSSAPSPSTACSSETIAAVVGVGGWRSNSADNSAARAAVTRSRFVTGQA